MLQFLPFDIIVIIAETSHEVWYLLSLTLKDFGLYSIRSHAKKNAMTLFDFRPISEPNQEGYLFKGKRHGVVIYKNSDSRIETNYNRGIREGFFRSYMNDVLRVECTYKHNERHGVELNFDKQGRKQSRYLWENGEVVNSDHICKKCRNNDLDFISCNHLGAFLETDYILE